MSRLRRHRPSLARGLALVAFALLLPSCGSLFSFGGKDRAVDLFNLTPITEARPDLRQVSWQLVVEEPVATGGLDTTRIAVRPSPNRLDYFAGARWTVRAPKMVQTLLVESLESSGRITAVSREAIGMRSDFNLRLELRELHAEVWEDRRRPTVRVAVAAKILRQPRQDILASRTFSAALPAEGGSVAEVVAAFDEAAHRVLRELVAWTLTAPPASEASTYSPSGASGER